MRSLRYILTGRPRNLDDCLNLIRRKRPVRVRLRLDTEEVVTEMFTRRELIGEYDWEFDDGSFRCREFCGSITAEAADPRGRSQLGRANRNLQRRLQQLQQVGVDVEGADRRFAC